MECVDEPAADLVVGSRWELPAYYTRIVAYTVYINIYVVVSTDLSGKERSVRGGRMSRAPVSRSGRSGNLKIAGSSPVPKGLNPGRVKPMPLKLVLFASYSHYWVGQRRVGSMSG